MAEDLDPLDPVEPIVPTPPARRLPVGYYLDNLESLLRFVVERSGDLLTAEERRFIDEFLGLGIDARRLWARLIVRRGPWFRVDRLRYSEIDLARAVAELVEHDFGRLANDAGCPNRRATRDAADRRVAAVRLSCGRVIKSGALRPEVLAATRAAVERAGAGERLARTYPVIAPLRLEELEVCRVLFFGNFSQSLEQFVLRDIGFVRFEPYDLDASGRRFESRADFDSVRQMRELRGSVAEVCRGRELEKILGEGKGGGFGSLAAAGGGSLSRGRVRRRWGGSSSGWASWIPPSATTRERPGRLPGSGACGV